MKYISYSGCFCKSHKIMLNLCSPGRRQLSKNKGVEDCYGTCKDVQACLHALHPISGVWGHALQKRFKFGFSEIASGAISELKSGCMII